MVRKVMKSLEQMTPMELYQEANLLLYGTRNVIEPGDERQIFSVLGGGAPKRVLLVYKKPKKHSTYGQGTCTSCNRPRYESIPGLCLYCYRSKAQEKFMDRSGFIEQYMDMCENNRELTEAQKLSGHRKSNRTNYG